MDFGRDNSSIAIKNPAAGHSPYIDEKAGDWADTEADILSYLSDVNKLEAMADKAANSEQLALVLEPFLDNAETYLESLGKIADGQVKWTEIRKKFGSKVANAIAKIRKLNAEFGSEMEQLDARDRAAMLKIETGRQHGLAEIASELVAIYRRNYGVTRTRWKPSQIGVKLQRKGKQFKNRSRKNAKTYSSGQQLGQTKELKKKSQLSSDQAISPTVSPRLVHPEDLAAGLRM
jgi:hypothetical protein